MELISNSQIIISVLSGLSGAIVTVFVNWIVAKSKHSTMQNIVDKRTDHERMELILKSSEDYREEMRKDMAEMADKMRDMKIGHQEEMLSFQKKYQEDIQSLQNEIQILKTELDMYRQENGALHLLLKAQGIPVPTWVKKD